jgi:hypothetical protein
MSTPGPSPGAAKPGSSASASKPSPAPQSEDDGSSDDDEDEDDDESKGRGKGKGKTATNANAAVVPVSAPAAGTQAATAKDSDTDSDDDDAGNSADIPVNRSAVSTRLRNSPTWALTPLTYPLTFVRIVFIVLRLRVVIGSDVFSVNFSFSLLKSRTAARTLLFNWFESRINALLEIPTFDVSLVFPSNFVP